MNDKENLHTNFPMENKFFGVAWCAKELHPTPLIEKILQSPSAFPLKAYNRNFSCLASFACVPNVLRLFHTTRSQSSRNFHRNRTRLRSERNNAIVTQVFTISSKKKYLQIKALTLESLGHNNWINKKKSCLVERKSWLVNCCSLFLYIVNFLTQSKLIPGHKKAQKVDNLKSCQKECIRKGIHAVFMWNAIKKFPFHYAKLSSLP